MRDRMGEAFRLEASSLNSISCSKQYFEAVIDVTLIVRDLNLWLQFDLSDAKPCVLKAGRIDLTSK